jgi:Kef-type K+ transport system membrane component KefB
MKTGLKNKVERMYNIFWILFFIIFGLDFVTTNLSIHVFGLRESNGFPGDIMPVENPLIFLAFFILVLVFAYGGTEYWRQKGIELYGRKSHEIITLIAGMVPLTFAVAMIPLVLRNLQRIFGIIT